MVLRFFFGSPFRVAANRCHIVRPPQPTHQLGGLACRQRHVEALSHVLRKASARQVCAMFRMCVLIDVIEDLSLLLFAQLLEHLVSTCCLLLPFHSVPPTPSANFDVLHDHHLLRWAAHTDSPVLLIEQRRLLPLPVAMP